MSDRPPSGLERLWSRDDAERQPRLGLSLERVVQSGVELADADGLAGVSMKRVAERLGFTTMSVYRYVTGKDELLLLMHDTCWRPPEGLEEPSGGWREALARWAREQYAIMRRHPWLEQVRHIDRAGTPSQIAWMELGLRAVARTPITEPQKIELLLVFTGYVFAVARNAATAADGARAGLFAPDQAAEAFAGLLRTVADAGRFPALLQSVEAGGFSGERPFPDFEFGLGLLLDGVGCLVARQAAS
jgi:AcrR family transcriptional regulator